MGLLSIISTGLSIFGKIQSGKAAKDAANYQAQVARNNAKVALEYGKYNAAVARNNAISARYNAKTATNIGDYNVYVSGQKAASARRRAATSRQNAAFRREQQLQVFGQAQRRVLERRIETRQLVGTQRATLAANGVVVDEGSALDLVTSTYEIGRRDQIRILSDAEIDVFDLEVDAYNFEAEASELNREAANYATEAQAKRYEAAVRTYDFEREALNYDNQALFAEYHAKQRSEGFTGDAQLAITQGRSAATSSYLGAAGTLLSGYADYRRAA